MTRTLLAYVLCCAAAGITAACDRKGETQAAGTANREAPARARQLDTQPQGSIHEDDTQLQGRLDASGTDTPRGTPAASTPGTRRDSLTVAGQREDPSTSSGQREGPPSATGAELAALSRALIVPVSGVAPADLLDTFDERRGTRRHDALDILAPRGTPVLSATDGELLSIFTSERGGLMLYASDASERFVLLYAHLDRYHPGLREGMRLSRGQIIGYVGTTGNAPANVPHLHFGIARADDVRRWWSGKPLDPLPLLVR